MVNTCSEQVLVPPPRAAQKAKLRSRCDDLAPNWPTSSQLWSKTPKHNQIRAKSGWHRLHFGRRRPEASQVRATSGRIGRPLHQIGITRAAAGNSVARFGHRRPPNFGRFRAGCGRWLLDSASPPTDIWSIPALVCPYSSDIVPDVVDARPNLAGTGRRCPTVDRFRKFGSKPLRTRSASVTSGETCCGIQRSWASSSGFGPKSAKFVPDPITFCLWWCNAVFLGPRAT